MTPLSSFQSLIETLPELSAHHAPTTRAYKLLREIARGQIELRFSSASSGPQEFAPFGQIEFPYHSMGAITSLELFGLDELILFSFYWANRSRYRRVADIGANIGLHSIVLDRCGYQVRSFEPDPDHYTRLRANLASNRSTNVEPVNAAVSDKAGEMEFVRVLGNTTGSHLAGAKSRPYGDLERFPVTLAIQPIIEWADLIKLDVEGHEKQVLFATTKDNWRQTDAMIEVGTGENAAAIFEFLSALGINMFAQKINWQKVTRLTEMPTSYRDGSLFLSAKTQVPW